LIDLGGGESGTVDGPGADRYFRAGARPPQSEASTFLAGASDQSYSQIVYVHGDLFLRPETVKVATRSRGVSNVSRLRAAPPAAQTTNLEQVGKITQVCCKMIICLTFRTSGCRMHHAFRGCSISALTEQDWPENQIRRIVGEDTDNLDSLGEGLNQKDVHKNKI